jgi:hypothetical protein
LTHESDLQEVLREITEARITDVEDATDWWHVEMLDGNIVAVVGTPETFRIWKRERVQ